MHGSESSGPMRANERKKFTALLADLTRVFAVGSSRATLAKKASAISFERRIAWNPRLRNKRGHDKSKYSLNLEIHASFRDHGAFVIDRAIRPWAKRKSQMILGPRVTGSGRSVRTRAFIRLRAASRTTSDPVVGRDVRS